MKDGSSVQSAHGRYRIQTVAELTGVPASTLRAWEQRYGFPAPERTASAYRLYSDGDVARIARVRALCEGGMAAAEAVAAVLAEAGAAPMPAPSSLAPTSLAPTSLAPTSLAPRGGGAIDLLELDARLRGALMLGAPRLAWTQTLAPAWHAVREAWLAGAIDRGEHRIAGEILGHAARDLVRLAQPTVAQGFALVGALGDDDDLVPTCGPALALQATGLRVLSLGPRTSTGALADAVLRFDPRLVVLAVIEPARAREAIDDCARAAAGRGLVLCGPGAAALAPVAGRHGAWIGDDDETVARALSARGG